MRDIINLDKSTNLEMFGDAPGGTFLRTDRVTYPILKELWESSLALFWTVKVVDFSNDAAGYKRLTPVAQRMFNKNNGYQSLMDSGVVGIYNHLSLLATNVEVALSYQQIAFTETIHATSYADGLQQMLGQKATEVIETVYTDPIVRARLSSEIDKSAQMIADPSLHNIATAIAATYLLEAIKFPFSFFVTLTINKGSNNAINGFAQLIARISQEEHEIHVPTNKHNLKVLIREGHITIDEIVEMADEMLTQELSWNQYLQEEGPIPGYNEAIGVEVISYFHNKALRDIGHKVTTIKPTSIIQWYTKARNPDNKQVSQQEMKSTQYQKGVVRNDLYKFDEDPSNA